MDSVESLNKFFTKLLEEHKEIAANAKKNSELLTDIYTSEKEEDEGRKKTAAKVKRRKDREKRNKKRHKLDTVKMLKETLNKVLGGDKKKGGWLKWLLVGGAAAALGLVALDGLKGEVAKRVGEAKDNITGMFEDWAKKLGLGIEEEAENMEEEAKGTLGNLEGQENSDGKATKPPAQPEAPAPKPTTEGKKEETEKEKKEKEKKEKEQEGGTTSTTKTTDKTETEETTVQTEETRSGTTTNRETTSTTTVTRESEPESTSSTTSRRNNRRSSSGRKKGANSDGGLASTVRRAYGGGKKDENKTDTTEGDAPITGGMMQKAKVLVKRLMNDMRISAAAAAGVVANLMHESGLKPDNVEDGKGFSDGPINNIPAGTPLVGYGYGQWTGSRLEKFRNWLSGKGKADKPASDEDNYQFLLHELRGAEPLKNHWKSGTSIPEKDPVEAANWFMTNWERPGEPHADRRQSYAKQLFSVIRKQQGGAIESGAASVSGVSKDARSLNPVSNTIGSAAKYQSGGSVEEKDQKMFGPAFMPWNWGKLVDQQRNAKSEDYKQQKNNPLAGMARRREALQEAMGATGVGRPAAKYQTGGTVTKPADSLNSFTGASKPVERLQGGGHVGKATEHIKKDEALSSLTQGPYPKGKSDWIREGGNSVITKTNWNEVKDTTKIHTYTDSVGQTTIGWGSTYYDNISNGKKPVKPGDVITKKKADQVLHENVQNLDKKYEKEMGPNWGKMSDSQRAGLLSMGYNAPNFYSSKTFAPTLKSALQKGDMKTAADNLSWGGPSKSRIAESQAMLRKGPMDLSKIKGPKIVGEKKVGQKIVGTGNPMLDKARSFFGGPKVGSVVKKQTGGEIKATSAPDTPNPRAQVSKAASSAPSLKQSMGSVASAGKFGQSMGSASPSTGFSQTTGAAAPASSLSQSMGSAAAASGFVQSMGSAAPASSLSQAIGSVAGAGKFNQSMGSAAPSAGFSQAMGSVSRGSKATQSMGSVVAAAKMGQSMGAPADSSKFVQSMGSAGSSDKFQQAMGSIASKMSKANPLALQTGGSVSGSTFVGKAPQSGGIVPGSGSGDQFQIDLPEDSFVLNREATRTIQKLQTGGVASVSTSKHINKLEERFFSANETYAKKQRKKKMRPVVVVQGGGGGGDNGTAAAAMAAARSPREVEGNSTPSLNMNMLRSRMRRVKAGARF